MASLCHMYKGRKARLKYGPMSVLEMNYKYPYATSPEKSS